MSHIHIPDGVLPWWLWVPGWLLTFGLLALSSRFAVRGESRRALPLIGAVSALVLVSMSSEVVPIAYHINLTVIAGVLLGPWLGCISAFIVVLVLALLGHGGVTVAGINTLVIASEMAIGWALVHASSALFGTKRIRLSAALATVLTLAITTSMLVGVVALAGAGATARETGALDTETLEFANPFSEGVLSVGLLSDDEPKEDAGALSVRRFATVVFTLGPLGWLLEALVTAAILGYVARVRPSLVFGRAYAEEHRARFGDEHGRH